MIEYDTEAEFWRRRAERVLEQCALVEETFKGALNQRAERSLRIWRLAALDYISYAQKLERAECGR